MDKIFAIYKPKGPTSYDMIRKIKKEIGNDIKIGHAGTLDPLASGILVIAIGGATKNISEEVAKEKEYIAKIKLGVRSSTDDEEGEKTRSTNYELRINIEEIEKVLKIFIGKIQQVPPVYSALKINGKEAYKRMRSGEVIEMKSREVEIKSIDVLTYDWPFLVIKVITGPGVYIRSLARDIGEKLGVWGYMSDLERTRVGDFTKENAIEISDIKNIFGVDKTL
ncbi:MAG: tRNA pseudouridine(55) synthase TruB [bacterium]|nr:tRNA pseudouridine(55) synthase TruB [bacterium]